MRTRLGSSIALVLSLLVSPFGSAQEMSAQDVLARMRKVYKECSSYRDSGTIVMAIESSEHTTSIETTFATAFVRPDKLRYSSATTFGLPDGLRSTEHGLPPNRHLVCWDGSSLQAWESLSLDREEPESLQDALVHASGSGSLVVLQRLFPKELGRSESVSPRRAKLLDEAVLDGATCLRIEDRASEHVSTVIWIDASSFLVRRVVQRTAFSEISSESTTTFAPVVDEAVPAESLAFDPPEEPERPSFVPSWVRSTSRDPVEETGGALVRVRAVNHQTGAAVEGQVLYAAPCDQEAGTGMPISTDKDGNGAFRVPPDREFCLKQREGGFDPIARVPPLEEGDVFELLVRVHTEDDAGYYGIVVDDETGEPIAGAEISGRETVATDSEGGFRTSVRTWQSELVEVTAPGYGRQVFVTDARHGDPKTARTLRLYRAASIVAEVFDEDGSPATGMRLEVRGDFFPFVGLQTGSFTIRADDEATWAGAIDSEGRYEVAGIAPKIPVAVELYRGAELVRRIRTRLKLAPGEEHTLDVRLGGGARVRGSVVDQHGAPVPGLELWLAPPPTYPHETVFAAHQKDDVLDRAVTDEGGAFELLHVQLGHWVIGPALPPRDREPTPEDVSREITHVAVKSDTESMTLDLKLTRGIFIRGKVEDSNGEPPAAQASVRATRVDGPPHYSDRTYTNGRGEFVIGPLLEGLYRLQTDQTAGVPFSAPARAHAGSEGVVLTVAPTSRVRGVVIDGETGERSEAQVSLFGGGFFNWNTTETSTGAFTLGGVKAGKYSVCARTSSGGIALSLVRVEEGVELKGLELVTGPGAMVSVTYSGPSPTTLLYAEAEGVQVASEFLERGVTAQLLVPVGEVILQTGGETRTVQATPDRMMEVEFP